jgi:hypothetical protein
MADDQVTLVEAAFVNGVYPAAVLHAIDRRDLPFEFDHQARDYVVSLGDLRRAGLLPLG